MSGSFHNNENNANHELDVELKHVVVLEEQTIVFDLTKHFSTHLLISTTSYILLSIWQETFFHQQLLLYCLSFIWSCHSIEDHPGCSYDGIFIFDGSSTSSNLLGSVCGERNNITFRSTGGYLTVRFKSDSINSESGFRADYRVVGK